MTSLTPFRWRRRVAVRDVDALGMVWYGHYLGYCDEARAEVLRAFDLAPGRLLELGYMAPVVELQARYHVPARFDDLVDVLVRVSTSGGTRLTFDFDIRRTEDETALARVASTQVLLSKAGGLVYLVPPEIRDSLDEMLAAQQGEPS